MMKLKKKIYQLLADMLIKYGKNEFKHVNDMNIHIMASVEETRKDQREEESIE